MYKFQVFKAKHMASGPKMMKIIDTFPDTGFHCVASTASVSFDKQVGFSFFFFLLDLKRNPIPVHIRYCSVLVSDVQRKWLENRALYRVIPPMLPVPTGPRT